MSIELTRSFLLWCTVINYGILLVWFLLFTLAHDWMRRFHGRWFLIPDALSFGRLWPASQDRARMRTNYYTANDSSVSHRRFLCTLYDGTPG
jgi:hypothetical protein